jgi:PAS domain-containing protein
VAPPSPGEHREADDEEHCPASALLQSSEIGPRLRREREASLAQRASFVIADPTLPDVPVTHASDGFLQLTGYSRAEVVGRNCRFLQGQGTDVKVVNSIREAVQRGHALTVQLRNYRRDGSHFWNLLHIAPVGCTALIVVPTIMRCCRFS